MKRLALALLLTPTIAAAEPGALYKCDADGAITIQSEPCPRGATQVWRRDATPESGPTPEELAARAALAEAEAQRLAEQARLVEQARLAEEARLAALERARGAEAAGAPPRVTECSQAHDFVREVDAKPWLDLSDAARTRLREWVAQQCRDPEGPGGGLPLTLR